MHKPSKTGFNRSTEGDSAVRSQRPGPPSPLHEPRRASRAIVIALAIAIGLGGGWIGGRVLSHQIRNSPLAEPASDAPATDGSTPFVPTPPEAQQPSKHNSLTAPPTQPSPEGAEPPGTSESPPQPERERKGTPPSTQKVKEDGSTESPTTEDSAKVGRQALKKMLEDVKKTRRGPANKNGNEDPH